MFPSHNMSNVEVFEVLVLKRQFDCPARAIKLPLVTVTTTAIKV